ncbi:MAG: molecular chaperone HtpG [Acidobacteriota bacterium]|jgi:molecular chaperone HtpG|nr:molecular chaperone HtpG [Acidobacteriota bacterium]
MSEGKEKKETFEFQSEVQQLLNILVYSLYQNQDVFLRELVSNAVDALNKVQFELLTHPQLDGGSEELAIHISVNQARKSLIIEDNGIGMTRGELIENLGTIAHSGTSEFLKHLSASKSEHQVDLIGKFGVGFYSAFMVAREIHVTTRAAAPEAQAWLWTSKGDTAYSIRETVKKERGTRIELLLKKEAQEFLDPERIRQVLKKHSRFVPFPIYLEKRRFDSAEAIWTQPKSSLSEEQYREFYAFLDHTPEKPLTWLHLSSDAPVQFNALLFVPAISLESMGLGPADPGVDLYSRKVLISKGNRDILPEYLRFLRGVIDSEDIPLNISRESIQHNALIERIRQHVVKKFVSHLSDLKRDDHDRFLKVWDLFSRHLREGVVTDPGQREALAPLLLFRSTHGEGKEWVDLDAYVERMKKEQKEIYFIAGTDLKSLQHNPALEAFRRRDMEVLLLLDPLDEIVLDHLDKFKDRPFRSAESADISLDAAEAETGEAERTRAQNLAAYLRKLYGDRVADVRLSSRLVEHPCMLTRPGDGPSAQMEKVMRMMHDEYQFARRILEINPGHPLIHELARIYEETPDSAELADLSRLLLDNQLLAEGMVESMDELVPRIQAVMLAAARKR